jgi:hypothetical protein
VRGVAFFPADGSRAPDLRNAILNAGPTRIETDSLGAVDVPAGVLWGAQTARSLRFFAIGTQRMPMDVIHAIAWIKWAAAVVNGELGALPVPAAHAIANAALRVADGQFDDASSAVGVADRLGHAEPHERQRGDCAPGVAGAGARRRANPASRRARRRQPRPVVNDVFPAPCTWPWPCASSRPAAGPGQLRSALAGKAEGLRRGGQGRPHPPAGRHALTLGQEFGGYEAQLGLCEHSLRHALGPVHALAIGGHGGGHRPEHPPALPDAEWQRWQPLLEAVELPLGKVLYESGRTLGHVYFPTTAIVSLLYVMEDGASAEIAVVGNEGRGRHLAVHGRRIHAQPRRGAKRRPGLRLRRRPSRTSSTAPAR